MPVCCLSAGGEIGTPSGRGSGGAAAHRAEKGWPHWSGSAGRFVTCTIGLKRDLGLSHDVTTE